MKDGPKSGALDVLVRQPLLFLAREIDALKTGANSGAPAVVAEADGGQEVPRLVLLGLLHGVLQEVHVGLCPCLQQPCHLITDMHTRSASAQYAPQAVVASVTHHLLPIGLA